MEIEPVRSSINMQTEQERLTEAHSYLDVCRRHAERTSLLMMVLETCKTDSSTNEKLLKPHTTARTSIIRLRENLPVGLIFGILLTVTTLVLQGVAFFTPHWKEVSPSAHSLYVDNVDALIRNEVLHYFNSIHRLTRHSYGLFERCETTSRNTSKTNYPRDDPFDVIALHNLEGKCSKNFLPSYGDENFNHCHSLSYYRFCTTTSAKIFDINADYLRVAFDLASSSSSRRAKISSPPFPVIATIRPMLVRAM